MKLLGTVTPPADMIGAARRDLEPETFDALMKATGGDPPTPAQLIKALEEQRNDHRTKQHPS